MERDTVYVMFDDGSGGPIPRSRLASALKLGARETSPDSIKTQVTADTPATGQEAAGRVLPQVGRELGRLTREAMPMLGAMGASMAVPPAAPLAWLARAAAAGAGGTAGGVAQQFSGRQPIDLRAAGRAGLEQGALQVGGEAIGGALRSAAAPLMRGAIRPNATMLQRSPTLVNDALEARAVVRSAGEPPKEALAFRGESAKKARGMIARADRTGVRVQYPEMSRRLNEMREEIARSGATDDKLATLDEFIDAFKAKWGGGARAADANALKRSAQANAKQVFKAERAGGLADEVQSTRARAEASVAKDVREALGRRIPGLNAQNARTQRGIELVKAMERAGEISPSRLDNILRAGGGMGLGGMASGGDALAITAGGLGAPLLLTPQTISKAAVLFSDPRFLQAARQLPRAGLFAVRDATGTNQ